MKKKAYIITLSILIIASLAFAETTQSLIQQGYNLIAAGKYQEAYDTYSKLFESQCFDKGIGIEQGECLHFFLITINAAIQQTALFASEYQGKFKLILERRNRGETIPKEETDNVDAKQRQMTDWAQETIELIEKSGGLKSVYEKIASANLYSAEQLNGFKEQLCVGYFNLALEAAWQPNGRAEFNDYFNKIKEAFPNSQTLKMLLDQANTIGKVNWKD